MTVSALDGITGLGPGAAPACSNSSAAWPPWGVPREELLAVSWLPDDVARTVFERLHRPWLPASPGAVRAKVVP